MHLLIRRKLFDTKVLIGNKKCDILNWNDYAWVYWSVFNVHLHLIQCSAWADKGYFSERKEREREREDVKKGKRGLKTFIQSGKWAFLRKYNQSPNENNWKKGHRKLNENELLNLYKVKPKYKRCQRIGFNADIEWKKHHAWKIARIKAR